MADIFDELLGSRPDATTLAAALRRKNTLGQLAELSGDRVLGPMGQRLSAGAVDEASGARRLQDAEAQQASLAKYRDDALGLQRTANSQAAGDRAADRALRQSIAEGNNARALEVARIMSQRQRALSAAQQATQQRHDDTQLNQLAGRLDSSNLGLMAAALRKAQGVLDKYPEGDIPGVGGLENIRKGGLGTAMTYVTGSGQQGRQNQAELADLQNMMLRIQSGQAVTDPELQRALVAQGLTEFNSADDLRKILPKVIQAYEQAVTNLTSGYRPELIDEYRRRGGLANWEARAPKETSVEDLNGLDDDQLLNIAQQLLNGSADADVPQ